ncbi:hypothetical protein LPJ77_003029 [Coemansia sp. RSA 2523]|nr:hypothetical protein LPJ69_004170 [Coemansia sp. RSA 1752]KAJ1777156.1 hypothetical protein LPJ54_002598 [Coemansia sp. RSA 1824]KAJ1784742.1 hypothetical protein LPJ62_004517 [Coemansia sp. RSA 2167]KAJ1807407.1 hypothetical protein LPJ77_003029 [Coemansia sp. RSA 2523]KAJ2129069.1 hypothetical protein GGF48_002586 [Coemansia sp. RSA 921]KAJ2147127.1 hypothetical protein IW142_001782 [Coemansia sp. RSA 564]KAJ2148073.1 hypothetical protein J3F82_004758 [Coemansia sp. RSA 637]KAJ2157970.1
MVSATFSQTFRLASRACGNSLRASQRQYSSNKAVPAHGEYRFRTSIERGRQQYTKRNMVTAAGLCATVMGVYFYSLYAVKQEDYTDIPMPAVLTEEEKAEFNKPKERKTIASYK